jgi:hypothetical protein
MIKLKYIHKVCGFCIVYKLCEGMSCYVCPVGRLLEIAKDKLAHPAPEPEGDDEPASD